MAAPETAAVVAALTARGETVRFVGGCVRDALLAKPVGDIDIATPDPPGTVIALIEAAGLKAVPTGVAHGTVTAVAGGRPFEVTTLRRDVETDGRHARVAFIDDWVEDAARRDFTFNAMFLDLDGTLYDPFAGRADLEAGRVRFVGSASRRIEEDVLRLLRYFRFFAWYGRPPADTEALAACRELAPRLEGLSGERVQRELFKLLGAPDPLPALALMAENGVTEHVLPGPRENWARTLAALVGRERARGESEPVRRLAAMVAGDTEALARRLRLSRADAERLAGLAAPPLEVDAAMDRRASRRALYRFGADRFRDLVLLAWAEAGGGADGAFETLLATAEAWRPVSLPVHGRDVLALGVTKGPRVGELLRRVEAWWEAGDYRATRDEALAYLAQIIERKGG
jgi:poly(A) polymerase